MVSNESVVILLVEDDPGHAKLIAKNLRRSNVSNEIVHLSDGQEAVDYLDDVLAKNSGRLPTPYLMLLDLNMPVMDGYQVLKHIKSAAATRSMPVIMLTTTDNPVEIARCYDLGCNVYITKPIEYEQFCEAIRSFGLFLSIVKIPEE